MMPMVGTDLPEVYSVLSDTDYTMADTGMAQSGLSDFTWTYNQATDGPFTSTLADSGFGSSLESFAPGISDQITGAAQPGEAWTDTLQRLLPTLATTYQQYQAFAMQMDRAKRGLPPLDLSQYGVGVSVGLSPTTMLLVGGGLLAVVLMMKR